MKGKDLIKSIFSLDIKRSIHLSKYIYLHIYICTYVWMCGLRLNCICGQTGLNDRELFMTANRKENSYTHVPHNGHTDTFTITLIGMVLFFKEIWRRELPLMLPISSWAVLFEKQQHSRNRKFQHRIVVMNLNLKLLFFFAIVRSKVF